MHVAIQIWAWAQGLNVAGSNHIHRRQRNYMHVAIQIWAFRRKPKKLKSLFSHDKKLQAFREDKENE